MCAFIVTTCEESHVFFTSYLNYRRQKKFNICLQIQKRDISDLVKYYTRESCELSREL